LKPLRGLRVRGRDSRLFPELAEGRLLNRLMNELSNMDRVIDAAQENYILLYSDFQAGFVIADRIGSTVEVIPNLFSDPHFAGSPRAVRVRRLQARPCRPDACSGADYTARSRAATEIVRPSDEPPARISRGANRLRELVEPGVQGCADLLPSRPC
jgi:hypothetical protein